MGIRAVLRKKKVHLHRLLPRMVEKEDFKIDRDRFNSSKKRKWMNKLIPSVKIDIFPGIDQIVKMIAVGTLMIS